MLMPKLHPKVVQQTLLALGRRELAIAVQLQPIKDAPVVFRFGFRSLLPQLELRVPALQLGFAFLELGLFAFRLALENVPQMVFFFGRHGGCDGLSVSV